MLNNNRTPDIDEDVPAVRMAEPKIVSGKITHAD
jgi:hypothetical protein